jgi:hypothetical protein
MENDNKTNKNIISVDSIFIDEAFDEFEEKDVMDMYWTIMKYKNIFDKLKDKTCMLKIDTVLRVKRDRDVFIESKDYFKSKGYSYVQLRKEYIRVIKEYLDYANPIYQKKKEEAYIIRREKEKENAKKPKLCSCGVFVSTNHYARHIQSKKHKSNNGKGEGEV